MNITINYMICIMSKRQKRALIESASANNALWMRAFCVAYSMSNAFYSGHTVCCLFDAVLFSILLCFFLVLSWFCLGSSHHDEYPNCVKRKTDNLSNVWFCMLFLPACVCVCVCIWAFVVISVRLCVYVCVFDKRTKRDILHQLFSPKSSLFNSRLFFRQNSK